MKDEKIMRINELARRSKKEGLTEEERREQKQLRQEYLDEVRASLRGQLNNIDIVNEDGSIENLGEKYGKKQNKGRGGTGAEKPDAGRTEKEK